MAARITPRTKLLLLNSPGNPTGAYCDVPRLQALLDVARAHGLFVLSDEIYADIVFSGGEEEGEEEGEGGAGAGGPLPLRRRRTPSVFDCPDYDAAQVMVVGGASKAFSMTGFRVGWLVAGSPQLAAVATKLQEPFVSCGSAFSQRAVCTALEAQAAVAAGVGAGAAGAAGVVGVGGGGATAEQGALAAELEGMRAGFERRRDAAVAVLKRRGRWRYTPCAAFYVLVDVRDCCGEPGVGDEAFAEELLAAEGVAVAPGSAFGEAAKGFVRVALAASEEDVIAGVERLCDFADAHGSARAGAQ